jgi:hypothetical protein
VLHTPTRGTRSSPTWDPRRHCGLLPSSNLGKMLDCASRLTPHSVLKVLEINLDRLKVNYGVSRGGHKWCSSGARAPLCGESASLAWTFRLAWETRHVEVGMWVARRRDQETRLAYTLQSIKRGSGGLHKSEDGIKFARFEAKGTLEDTGKSLSCTVFKFLT